MMISTTIVLICVELLTIAYGQRRRFSSFDTEAMQKTEMNIPTNTITVQGVAGLNASLPCNIQTQNSSDTVTMVLWFKEPNDEPVYSYDARNLRFDKAKVSGAEYSWSSRTSTRDTVPTYLLIQNVQEADVGEYRCRVDFHNSPTKNLKVNFTIIVPPSKPIIYDTKRRDMSKHLEAYPEGSDLDLICEVHGGKPKPRVSWYLESQLMNSTYETKSVQNTENNIYSSSDMAIGSPYTIISSRVAIKNLKRSHQRAKLSCRADNTELAAPQTTTILIELNMKPLKIEILEKEEHVSANKKYKIKCRSTGSRPAATLTWYKGSKQLKNSSRDFQKDETSISILEWVPNADDEGKYLTCRAENRHLPEAAIEDKWKLKVLFSPIVLLRVGSSANLENIKEGDNVSFECNVRSNPRNFTLKWYHGNKELRHNASTGVVLSDQSLNLQGITREASGNYSCLAANSQGRNRSNVIYLHVMFAPICKRLGPISLDEDAMNLATEKELGIGEERPINTSHHGLINLVCEVEASPSTVKFHWTFNNSKELSDVADFRYSSDRTISKLSHPLRTDADYGTFGCWASNFVGDSKQPCLYLVPPPVNPLPLQNCTAYNESGTWIRISCVEGFDGGLPQKFVAVVGKQRWESSSPYWEIEIHKPTTVSLYAVNAKGSSEPIVMEGIAFKDVAKFTGETGISLDISPILIGLGGTATGLGLIVTGVLMALWRKHAASPSKEPKPLQQPSIATFAGKGEEEDGNPDLIPTAALTNNYAEGKLSVYGSLPRRSHYTEDEQQILQGGMHDMSYLRAAPNTYYSLQRPSRYTETIVRHTTVQESCI